MCCYGFSLRKLAAAGPTAAARDILKGSRHAESYRDVAQAEPVPAARRGPQFPRRAVHRAAAHDVQIAIADGKGRTIGRGAGIVCIPAVRQPGPTVAGGVVEIKGVGSEAAGRRQLPVVEGAAAAVANGAIPADLVPPPVGTRRSGAVKVFVFRLG